MKRKTLNILVKIVLWIIKHIYIQGKNINKGDDTKPVESVEVGLKGTF